MDEVDKIQDISKKMKEVFETEGEGAKPKDEAK